MLNIITGINCIDGLNDFLKGKSYSNLAILTDQNVYKKIYKGLKDKFPLHQLIVIKPGERYKSLDSCKSIWSKLEKWNFDRNSLLINLGGGMISDLGGFTASVYKRGIRFINIPTTLLAQTDAAFGGKTSINFNGFKNNLGTFSFPELTLIDFELLKTLNQRQFLNGWAEIIKYALIADKELWDRIKNMVNGKWQRAKGKGQMTMDNRQRAISNWEIGLGNPLLNTIIEDSIAIKKNIVSTDPLEKGSRKLLNFGHTIGHALESYFTKHSKNYLLHGEGVIIGIVVESWISFKKGLLSEQDLNDITIYLSTIYAKKTFKLEDIDKIIFYSIHDKKNNNLVILCVLLEKIGKAVYNQPVKEEDFREGLNYYLQFGVK